MNKILEKVLEARNGHYVHALEVNDVYELQSCVDSLYDEFSSKYSSNEVNEFITSLQIYCLDDSNEDEVYNFNINEYLNELI